LLIFILLSLSMILGMGFAVLSGSTASGIFLLLAAVFLTCGIIPFWFRHAGALLAREWSRIRNDEEPVPALTILFLMLSCACIGSFRYVSELNSDYAGHLKKICEKHEDSTTWNVRGQILEEPVLKNDFLEVLIRPETIRRVERKRAEISDEAQTLSKKGRKSRYETVVSLTEAEPVKGGLILAQVFDDTEAFRQVDFNQTIEIEGRLNSPSEVRNPGSLDFKKHLRNRGIFRTIRIVRNKGSLRVLGAEEGGSWWYRFALHVKDEVLRVIKQTMPYPESSFLGGVLLGLKGGLPARISQEFRMTGVSHVLAVSGLHVTIIAGLLYGIFSVLKIPLRVFAPLIVFALFTFALIVGWPSSAVRAALMNSLFILSRAYLQDRGFKLTVIFSLSVAADYILMMSPLQLTEPSFILSFMAIYALAMFSEPSGEYLRKILRGPGLLFAFLATLTFFLTVIIKKSLVLEPWFFTASFVYVAATLLISERLAATSTFQSFAFEMLPVWLQSFLGAQIAILVAMMGPLSAFYFGQFSLVSPIANIIAIPLIGIIVQIGLIAGLIGSFVPVVGIYLALILNAANWLAVKFFLKMATFFAMLIPFPRVSQPGFPELALYYILLHVFFFHRQIIAYGRAFLAAVLELWEEPDYKMSMSMIGIFAVIVLTGLAVWGLSSLETKPDFRATMLDVGFGSALLIEDRGKTVLIDAGLNDVLAGFDRGERVIQPALSEKKVDKIDAVILTTSLPERISGLSSVMSAYKVERIFAPFPLPENLQKVSFGDFVGSFSLADVQMEKKLKRGLSPGKIPDLYWESAYESYNRLIEDVRKYQVPFRQIKAGDKLESIDELVEVLFPSSVSPRFSAYYEGLILRIKAGERNIIYCSGNVHSLEDLVSFSPDYVLMADLPYPYNKFERFIKSRSPEGVGVSFRMPPAWLIDDYHLSSTISSRNKSYLPRFREWRVPVYVTGGNGAVVIDKQRSRYRIFPYIKE